MPAHCFSFLKQKNLLYYLLPASFFSSPFSFSFLEYLFHSFFLVMGNRISRRTKSKSSAESSNGESIEFSDGATSTHSTPKFPDFPLATSETEIARERNEHFLLKHVFQKSYFAPIDSILERKDSNVSILDYGCGVCFSWIIGE